MLCLPPTRGAGKGFGPAAAASPRSSRRCGPAFNILVLVSLVSGPQQHVCCVATARIRYGDLKPCEMGHQSSCLGSQPHTQLYFRNNTKMSQSRPCCSRAPPGRLRPVPPAAALLQHRPQLPNLDFLNARRASSAQASTSGQPPAVIPRHVAVRCPGVVGWRRGPPNPHSQPDHRPPTGICSPPQIMSSTICHCQQLYFPYGVAHAGARNLPTAAPAGVPSHSTTPLSPAPSCAP